ncbi:MAG: glycosyltransferase [bacterium]
MNQGHVKILFVHSSSEMYGSDRCLYELLKRIDKKQFTPVVVLPFEGILADKLRAAGIAVYITDPWVLRKGVFHGLKFVLYLLRLPISIFRLIQIIRKERISVVYSNTSVILGGALSAFIMRRPHIFHIRELYDNYPKLSVFYKYFLCSFSKKIIVISKSVAEFVRNTCYKKVNVIYDGIAIERFNNTHHIPDMLSAWVQRGYVIVSNIGRISKIKGQELFIDVAHMIAKQNEHVRFLIVGDVFKGNEQYMGYLRSLIHKYNMDEIIMFTGFRDDIDDFINYSNIIVVTTLITEGLGQIVMEGMAAGKVVIAPSRGGPAELIENGKDGILYRSGDHNALAEALSKAVNNPELRRAIGQKAKTKAEECFDISQNVRNIDGIIKDVIEA